MKGYYRYYIVFAMALLVFVNFVDRQIITVLAPFIRKDLGVSNAQLGMLYGTTFALFYGVLGIPIAKLADDWNRVWTLSLGLALWSLMSIGSGLAFNFPTLALARVGVGVGEATTSPAAISLLCDYFRKETRSTVISAYSMGSPAGAGVALILGGLIVASWQAAFPVRASAPLGLAGWQAAFIVVGVPGLLYALFILLTVKEPRRGLLDGQPYEVSKRPWIGMLREAATMFPPWSFLGLRKFGSKAQARANIVGLVGTILIAILLTHVTDGLASGANRSQIGAIGSFTMTSNFAQWVAIGIAAYATGSWIQLNRLRDPVSHTLISGSPTFIVLALNHGLKGIIVNSLNAFVFVYASRYLGFTSKDGLTLGTVALFSGLSGFLAGGVLGDWSKRWHPAGRLYFSILALAAFCVFALIQYTTASRPIFYACFGIGNALLATWPGCGMATAQDLVLPRMRGMAYAVISLGTSVIGLGLGPYCVGLLSDLTGNLRQAILCVLAFVPLILWTLWWISRRLPHDEATVELRARQAGERI